jgi:hypothetical protein
VRHAPGNELRIGHPVLTNRLNSLWRSHMKQPITINEKADAAATA